MVCLNSLYLLMARNQIVALSVLIISLICLHRLKEQEELEILGHHHFSKYMHYIY